MSLSEQNQLICRSSWGCKIKKEFNILCSQLDRQLDEATRPMNLNSSVQRAKKKAFSHH